MIKDARGGVDGRGVKGAKLRREIGQSYAARLGGY